MRGRAFDLKLLKEQFEEREIVVPFAFVDMQAFKHNRALLFDHFAHAAGVKLRIATKSLRCGLLIKEILDHDSSGNTLTGVMTFKAGEAAHLAGKYGVRDLLTAYPTTSPVEARQLAKLQGSIAAEGGAASIVVDCKQHVQLLAEAAKAAGVEIPLVIDLSVAFQPLGSRGPHLGARRSPIVGARDVRALAEQIRDSEGVRLHGLMSYDAHHAAVPDSKVKERIFKKVSLPAIERIRKAACKALEDAGFGPLPVLNGGGSGSYLTASKSKWLNEVAAGSAFYMTALFDNHEQLKPFQPSLFYALQVVRRPSSGWATAFGGGYYSSAGGIAPVIHQPSHLKTTKTEGFGEVQTPLEDSAMAVEPGDLVIVRPAKAGEPLERFNQIYPFEDGHLGEPLATYRGEGRNFG